MAGIDMGVCSHSDRDPADASGPCATAFWRLGPGGAVCAMNGSARAIGVGVGVGGRWREAWPAETRAAVDEALQTARGGETAAFRAQIRWGSRERVKVEVAVAPLFGPGGDPEGFSASARDVTEELQTA